MKRHLSIILRTLLALAGVAYIVFTLTWTDHLSAPVGATLPDGQVLTEPQRFKVLERTHKGGHEQFIIFVQPHKDERETVAIDAARVGDGENQFHFEQGIVTTLGTARPRLLLIGLAIVGLIYPLQMVRWWMLMVCRGMDVTLWKALRLNMVGAFFNFCMPGTTGGDVVKAYYAAKGSGRSADAVMSVVFDRIAGLVGLIVLTGIAGLVMVVGGRLGWLHLSPDHGRLVMWVTVYIWLGIFALTCGTAVYFSHGLRRKFHIDALLARLPGGGMLAKIDAAAVAYRHHRVAMLGAVALSLPVHLALVGGAAAAGYALGMEAPLGLLITVMPVIFFAGAVPLTPLGLGVMEGLGYTLLVNPPAVTYNHIVGMLMLWRLYQIAYASLGSIMLLKGDIHLHPQRDEGPLPTDAGAELGAG